MQGESLNTKHIVNITSVSVIHGIELGLKMFEQEENILLFYEARVCL